MLTVYATRDAIAAVQKMDLPTVKSSGSAEIPSCIKLMPVDIPINSVVTKNDDSVTIESSYRGRYPFLDRVIGKGNLPRSTRKINMKDIQSGAKYLEMAYGEERPAMIISLLQCGFIRRFLSTQNISYDDLEETDDGRGILLTEKKGQVVIEKVRGEKRPAVSCVDTDEKRTVYGRPYMDEFHVEELESMGEKERAQYRVWLNRFRLSDLAENGNDDKRRRLTVFIDDFESDTADRILKADDYAILDVRQNLKIMMTDEPFNVLFSIGDGFIDIENQPRPEVGDFSPELSIRGRYDLRLNRFEGDQIEKHLYDSLLMSLSVLSFLSSSGIDVAALDDSKDCISLLIDDNDNLSFNIVCGYGRPNLAGYTVRGAFPGILTGKTVACRPYEDEKGNYNAIMIDGFDDEEPSEEEREYRKYMEIEQATNPKFVKKAADAGDPHAMRKYAEMLYGSDEADPEEFFRYMEQASKLGDVPAMRYLGLCYTRGIGTNPDINKAIELYEKVIEQDPQDGDILNELGHCYIDFQEFDFGFGLRTAVDYFQRAAEAGQASAINNARLWSYVLKLYEAGELDKTGDPLDYVYEKADSGSEEAQIAFSGSVDRWENYDREAWKQFNQGDN